jgi:zinc protease
MMGSTTMTNNSLPGPENITRVVLPNGITVMVRSNFNNPSIYLTGYLATGAIFDPQDKLGLAAFTASILTRGTFVRSFNQIFESLESAGASLAFGGNVHTTSFHGKSLTEDFPMLLELLNEVLTTPSFPAEHVERFRHQMLTGLAMKAQDTGEMASLAFDQILFAGHPYRFPEDGYPETVQAITREDIVRYHQRHFGPKGMVLVVVGAIEPAQVLEMAQTYLGGWTNPDQVEQPALPYLEPLTQTTTQTVLIPGKSQADIVLGNPAPLRKSDDYMPASVGNNILGVFGMMGRIGDIVREQSGLAYYSYTSLNSGFGPGSWEVLAGVNPANIEKAIDLIKAEIGKFIREPVSAEELQNSQDNFIGRLPLSLESNAGVAGSLMSLERYQLGLDYFQRYEGLVRAVTPEQILAVSQKYLNPDKMAIGIARP